MNSQEMIKRVRRVPKRTERKKGEVDLAKRSNRWRPKSGEDHIVVDV